MEIESSVLDAAWFRGGSWIGLLWLISYWIRRATKDFDDDLAPEYRSTIAEGLRRYSSENAEWMTSFLTLFTAVFGWKHLSWRCLSRSLSVSVGTFLLLGFSMGTFIISPEASEELGYRGVMIIWGIWVLFLVSIGLIYNGLLDYLSLWKARLIIQSAMPIAVKVILEVLVTALLVYVGFLVLIGVLTYVGLETALRFDDNGAAASVFLLFTLAIIPFMKFPPDFGTTAFVMFATSFSVSVWVLLHGVSGVAIKVIPSLFSALNVNEKPIRALGVVGVVAVWGLGLIALFVVGIVSWAGMRHAM